MLRYLGRRLLQSLLLFWGVSILAFVFVSAAPGDFTDTLLMNPQVSSVSVAAERARYGLDQSLPQRYSRWIGGAIQGNLGYSFAYNAPVGGLIWTRARNTLILTVTATLLAWLIAVPLGVWSAARKGGLANLACTGVSGLIAIPDLLLALGFLFVAVRTGWFPAGGMVSVGFEELSFWAKVKDVLAHLTLPLFTLVLGMLPILVQHVRAAVSEALEAPFLRAAQAHGIPRRRLLFRYALPFAANPLISLFGLSLATLLSASLLVEVIMGWPGLGPLILGAVESRDIYVLVGAALASTAFLLAGNWVSDVLLYAHDPRIRAE
ncbi:MAG TPA: ABC transporter permease [Candidatus Acidoferrales bacterium]|nr:ABC transporter permease [Candidatus Acidoferrales bacterium]